jgi:hypothetical protein
MDAAIGGIERENGVGADAGDGVVRGDEFGAGTGAGAENVGHFEEAVHGGFMFGVVGGGDNLDVVDDLGELGFLEVNRAESGGTSENRGGGNDRYFSHGSRIAEMEVVNEIKQLYPVGKVKFVFGRRAHRV